MRAGRARRSLAGSLIGASFQPNRPWHAVEVHRHDHGESGHADPGPARLGLAAAVNGGFGVAQIVGGLVVGSVAVLADAVHQGADAVGLLLALGAALLARRPPSARRTFGWGRVDAVG